MAIPQLFYKRKSYAPNNGQYSHFSKKCTVIKYKNTLKQKLEEHHNIILYRRLLNRETKNIFEKDFYP